MKIKNPFTPTFGIVPLHLAGRTEILSQMVSAFDNGVGDPNLSTILVGARGSGKTSLLSCIATEAEQRGWVAVTVVASEGMLDDILQRTLEASQGFLDVRPKRHLAGIEIAQILGIEWVLDQPAQGNWRTRMNALLDALNSQGIGLVICVDEVNVAVREMVRLASTYQLFIGEGKQVALVMAGLPKQTTELIDSEEVSFLRRARQRRLGAVSDAEIARAFRASVEDGGKAIGEAALQRAVEAVGGYPYMMQLVGYCAWENSRDCAEITGEHVGRGIVEAKAEFRAGVLDSTFREMSKGDRAFAKAMLAHAGGCTLAEVASAMGKPSNYASAYRRRLFDRGVITERTDGALEFALPFLREYLAERLGEDVTPLL